VRLFIGILSPHTRKQTARICHHTPENKRLGSTRNAKCRMQTAPCHNTTECPLVLGVGTCDSQSNVGLVPCLRIVPDCSLFANLPCIPFILRWSFLRNGPGTRSFVLACLHSPVLHFCLAGSLAHPLLLARLGNCSHHLSPLVARTISPRSSLALGDACRAAGCGGRWRD
jgi:hypothetical protein